MATISRTNGGARNLGTDAANIAVTGRTLTHYTVTSGGLLTYGNGTNINYLAAGSDYEKLVLAIEQIGSIELLGQPLTGNLFHVAIIWCSSKPINRRYFTTSILQHIRKWFRCFRRYSSSILILI
jgi:hypothetical protein